MKRRTLVLAAAAPLAFAAATSIGAALVASCTSTETQIIYGGVCNGTVTMSIASPSDDACVEPAAGGKIPVTIEALKRARKGRVYIDIQRNAFGQTIVAPYSVRRRPGAAVSTPLSWDEATPELEPGRFNLRTIESRLVSEDPWIDFWDQRQELPAL